jgi:hypothetical protein
MSKKTLHTYFSNSNSTSGTLTLATNESTSQPKNQGQSLITRTLLNIISMKRS